jgi:predicted RNA binding protein YcfA (HicA-like mRNA interferase family)
MGFKIVRQSGSYIHLWNEKRRILVTVPNHKELAKGTLNAIIKQSKMDKEELLSNIK